MSTKTTLYKLDSNNKVREWTCWTEEDPTNRGKFLVIIRHGLMIGSQVFEKQLLDTEEQAKTEASRRIRKQKERKGYTDYVPTERPLKPMLAQTYQDHVGKMPETVIFQPKLDGYRCLGAKARMETRTSVPLPAFPHIQHALSFLPEDVILDGELYNHNSRFQQIMKSKTGMHSLDSFMIEYHVFDCVEPALSFSDRRVSLAETVLDLMAKYEQTPFYVRGQVIPFPIMPVKTFAGKLSETENYYNKFINEKYEGVMLRDPSAKYELDHRSYGLLKYKKRDSDYFKIIDVIPGKRRKDEGVLVCKTAKGISFNCTFAATAAQKSMIINKPELVIGRFIRVEYLGWTDDHKPRNAQGIELA